MYSKTKVIILIAVAAAIGLGYVLGSHRQAESLVTVHTYMVPTDRTDEVKAQLNYLMSGAYNGEPLGRAQVFSNGLLVVRAPESYQQGIRKMIDQLSRSGASPHGSVHIDYWLVTGAEDEKASIDDSNPLSQVFKSIAATDGERKFRVLEHLATNSISGQEVMVQGSVSKATSTSMLGPDVVRMKLDFDSRLGKVKSETRVKYGEFLVIGQNAVPQEDRGLKLGPLSGNVYYIVRAELMK